MLEIVVDEHVVSILFTDCVWNPVMEGIDGRQHDVNTDGNRVYGVWFIPYDNPQPDAVVGPANDLLGDKPLAGLPDY